MLLHVKPSSHTGRKNKLTQMVVATRAWRGNADEELTLSKIRNALFTNLPVSELEPENVPGRLARWLDRGRR